MSSKRGFAVVTSSSIIVFVFDDLQTTSDRSNHAPYDDVTKRTKGESGLLFDTHMSHKHLMDSVNCIPGGKSMQAHNKARNDQS